MFVNSLNEDGTPPKLRRYGSFAEMKTQTAEFFREFHSQQTSKVHAMLDAEKWKISKDGQNGRKTWESIDIRYIMSASENNNENKTSFDNGKDKTQNEHSSSQTNGKGEPHKTEDSTETAESFFVLMETMVEYCKLSILPNNAEVMLGLVDLLRAANSRIAHLVLGAGAVELKICKSITVSNLVIVARGLCLVIEMFPQIKDVFREAVASKNHHMVSTILYHKIIGECYAMLYLLFALL